MYYSTILSPQFADTDMQGHINFLAYSNWFDRVRVKLYKELSPDLNFREHGIVVLHTEVTFMKEVYVQFDVEVRTWVSVLGTKSFEVTQELWQNGERCSKGKTIFCAFDFTKHKSEEIKPHFRAALDKYRYDPAEI